MERARVRWELLRTYAAVTLVTAAVTYVPGVLVQQLGQLTLAAVFLFGALWLSRGAPGGAQGFGIDLSGVLEPRRDPRGALEPIGVTARRALRELGVELAVACLAALVVFPPYVAVYALLVGSAHPFTLHLPKAPVDFALGQLLVVALPEEALFRGYFQSRLGALGGRRVRVLGVQLAFPALVGQAVLFALLHYLVGFQPARLSVFFPGLVFGWLRAARGGIGASTWFHALCNVLAELLARGYA